MNERIFRPKTALAGLLAVLSALVIGAWVWQVGTRSLYALDLEWMESGALHQAWRIMRGQAAYPEPSSEFAPHLYTPGYSVVLALLGQVFKLDFPLARTVSLLSCVASALAILAIVRREGRSALAGWVGVALYLGSFRFCYRWMDLARSDALMVALVLWGLYFLRNGWGFARNVIWAGVLMAAAYWVKQSAFVIIVGSGVAALWVAPRKVWIYVGVIGVLAGVGTWLYTMSTEGWFWHYVFELHQTHRFNAQRLRHKSWAMILHSWPFVIGMLGAGMARATAPWWTAQRKLDRTLERLAQARQSAFAGPIYWGIMTVTMAAAGAISYSTQWAEPNAFMPFCAGVAVLVAVWMGEEGRVGLWERALVAAQLVLMLLCEPHYPTLASQGFKGLWASYRGWDPWLGQPTHQERQRANELARDWRALAGSSGLQDRWGVRHHGTLLALQHPWWSLRNGGAQHVASMAMNDVTGETAHRIRAQLAQRIEDQEFAAIWVEGPTPHWLARAMRANYGLAQLRRGEARVLPMSGWMSRAGTQDPYRRAQRLYLAAKPVPLPTGCQRLADFEDATGQGLSVTQGDLPRGPGARRVGGPLEYAGGAGQYAWMSGSGPRPLVRQGRATLELGSFAKPVELRLGSAWLGRKEGLSVVLKSGSSEVGSGSSQVELGLAEHAGEMERQRVSLAPSQGPWRLVIQDSSPHGALVIDEIWICSRD